ncbi:hypothetical protein, partial [Bifidobacterium saguini]|uniref:hypothetical protein n=1 Tax=Bifidobacterium saguini TaxID=762210 RepID=UPI0005513007
DALQGITIANDALDQVHDAAWIITAIVQIIGDAALHLNVTQAPHPIRQSHNVDLWGLIVSRETLQLV